MPLSRRRFLESMGAGVLSASLVGLGAAGESPRAEQPNVLLLTADDMNGDSVGAFGCPVSAITPNIDRLAAEGMRFEHAHTNASICAPSRTSMLTGREPHNHGVMADGPFTGKVPALGEMLRTEAGYLTGVHGKYIHLDLQEAFGWDIVEPEGGRHPARFHHRAATFFERAQAHDQPFFWVANVSDPHRPLAGRDSAGPDGQPASVRRVLGPDEVPLPGFLPDLPRVRKDVAAYFTSVYRADECVGAVLSALEEAGLHDSTLVIFLSDHGMPFPFAKHECYHHSTKTPLVVRWPGRVEAGAVERRHMVSEMDLTPTVLEAAGLAPPPSLEGRSLMPLLRGQSQEGREAVYSGYYFHRTSHPYPVRSVQTRRFRYIVTFWAFTDKSLRPYISKPMTYRAMEEAAEHDEAVAERFRFYLRRTPEELYDIQQDPDCRHNLINDPGHARQAERMRRMLQQHLEETNDPALEPFEARTPEAAARYLAERQKVGEALRAKKKRHGG
jgi:N-sulfoglucosamine sulfohydrolase